MKKKRDLYIYGTVLNNGKYIERCIRSIQPLRPKAIIIADAGSIDGTQDKLKAMGVQVIDAEGSSRGKGRQIALNKVYELASNKDFALYIDLDTVYKPLFISSINKRLKSIKDYEFSYAGLATIKTNKLAEWRDLNGCEDWERIAHLIAKGCRILDMAPPGNDFHENRESGEKRQFKREQYYSSTWIGKLMRVAKNLIDEHRAIAYKDWRGLSKRPLNIIANDIAHLIAVVLGLYSYDKKLDNMEYIKEEYAKANKWTTKNKRSMASKN